ncbi:hypothetical protein EPI10_003758 [Gossypium australe]|uniref:Uncharacterized protein n=1 Tax=Gossypium australe TaxID=47621 RepID=A0A5B6UKP0_9ROSI|nr:hypothetical protein EPI10_003758 [Gossypium australe]
MLCDGSILISLDQVNFAAEISLRGGELAGTAFKDYCLCLLTQTEEMVEWQVMPLREQEGGVNNEVAEGRGSSHGARVMASN